MCVATLCAPIFPVHSAEKSLSSHLIFTTPRVPRGRCRADQSQRDATMTKRPALGCCQPRNAFSRGNGHVLMCVCTQNVLHFRANEFTQRASDPIQVHQ
ncbi:hypothetical protein KUCAC02_006775, partial [Chaenocephalus aceratus]